MHTYACVMLHLIITVFIDIAVVSNNICAFCPKIYRNLYMLQSALIVTQLL